MANDAELMRIADQLALIAKTLGTLNQHLLDLNGKLDRIGGTLARQTPGGIPTQGSGPGNIR